MLTTYVPALRWLLCWGVQVAFSEAVNARIVQNVVFVMAGLAVLMLLRAAHHRFYARSSSRLAAPGGLHSSPHRRSPLR